MMIIILKPFLQMMTTVMLKAKLLYEQNLIDVFFLNVYIILRLYLRILLTDFEAERSFSKLALV